MKVTSSTLVIGTTHYMVVYTYLLKSENDSSYYTGISNDYRRRLAEHNSGKSKATTHGKPWLLVYIKEHSSYAEARNHEKWLKKKNREYKEKLAQLAPPEIGGVK